jgi:hypothetical protein
MNNIKSHAHVRRRGTVPELSADSKRRLADSRCSFAARSCFVMLGTCCTSARAHWLSLKRRLCFALYVSA